MWKVLDLRSRKPARDQLVNLRLEDRKTGAVTYMVGKFEVLGDGKKLWFLGNGNVIDPTRWTKFYEVWWIPVQPFLFEKK